MSDIVIIVENLSKLYKIGARQNRHDTLRDKLTEVVAAPFRRLSSVFGHSYSVVRPRSSVVNSSVLSHRSSVVNSSVLGPQSSIFGPQSSVVSNDTIWALKDISFSVKRGEVIGIIGRNGAGKTTLLKILSRITEPTEGQAEICGRVSSLLEVGTGFHPELTGQENIYLNGAILGMKKAEIEHKFDEIVAFAEIEKFIDTPVKHYSSGMYVRLAFAVAAHLEPEILLVDEVLAVGDAAFQKKCLGKMGDVAREGRTVLFVSHNMGAVNHLCQRAIMLHDGSIFGQGSVQKVIQQYLNHTIPRSGHDKKEFHIEERPEIPFQILGVAVTDAQGEPAVSIGLWEQAYIRVDFLVRRELIGSNLAVWISRDGTTILNSHDIDLSPEYFKQREAGYYRAIIPLPSGLLSSGTYTVSADAGIMMYTGSMDMHRDVVSFEVIAEGEDLLYKSYSRRAMVIARLPWRIEKLKDVHE